MTNNYDAHRLAIKNLEVIEQAFVVLIEAQSKTFKHINDKFKRFIEDENWDYEGGFNFPDDEITIKPKNWLKCEDGSYKNWFSFASENDDEGQLWISHLVGCVTSRMGLWFGVDVTNTTRRQRYNAGIWQRYLRQHEATLKLQEIGFEVIDDQIFLPIKIGVDLLSECYPNAIDDALTPIDDALAKIKNNLPLFEQIIKDAETYNFV